MTRIVITCIFLLAANGLSPAQAATDPSRCYAIRDPDLRNACLAETRDNKGQCYAIRDHDRRQLCLAQTTGQKSTYGLYGLSGRYGAAMMSRAAHPLSQEVILRYAAFTHPGKHHGQNQDALLVEGRVIQAAAMLSGVLPGGQTHRFAISDGVSSSPQRPAAFCWRAS